MSKITIHEIHRMLDEAADHCDDNDKLAMLRAGMYMTIMRAIARGICHLPDKCCALALTFDEVTAAARQKKREAAEAVASKRKTPKVQRAAKAASEVP